jgi:DNA-binding response OmpR family regulator/signal transduction histidine kinase
VRVLLVEDDDGVAGALVEVLSAHGHVPRHVRRGEDALLEHRRSELVLLDLGLPDGDGLEVLRKLRRVASIPVVVLTARGDERSVVRGLRLGADDYLVKPVRMAELLARMDAVARRSRLRTSATPPSIVVDDVTVDLAGRRVLVDGAVISLTAKEFDLLAALARRSGVAVSREQLMDEVWATRTSPCPARSMCTWHRCGRSSAGPGCSARCAASVTGSVGDAVRWRLLVALLAFAAVAVAGFAWPLLASTSAERTQQLVISRTADLDRFAALADQALASGDTVALDAELRRYAELYGEAVLVVDTRRAPVLGSGGLAIGDPAVGALVDGALRNQPAGPVPDVRPWSSSEVLLARPVGIGTRVAGAIVLRASVGAAAAEVARRWAVIIAGAVLAAAAFTGLAFLVSRWVLRPLRELEDGVRATAAGTARAHVRLSGPPELRELESEFNRMSDAVADAAERQRRLVADASHQLRNPMAALRLRMDTLGTTVGTSGTYASALAEVERLESLLDGLLALATADSKAVSPAPESTCDLAEVLTDRLAAWESAASSASVVLSRRSEVGVVVGCPADDLSQVLDVVLDNAIKYAGAGATVTVDHELTDGHLHLLISDDGPGLPAEDLHLATERFWRADHHQSARGTGLGLAIADRLVVARGGSFSIAPTDPHGITVRITLPVAP